MAPDSNMAIGSPPSVGAESTIARVRLDYQLARRDCNFRVADGYRAHQCRGRICGEDRPCNPSRRAGVDRHHAAGAEIDFVQLLSRLQGGRSSRLLQCGGGCAHRPDIDRVGRERHQHDCERDSDEGHHLATLRWLPTVWGAPPAQRGVRGEAKYPNRAANPAH